MRCRNRRRPSRTDGKVGGRGGESVRARGRRDLRAAAGEVGQGREEGESSGFGRTGEDERGDFNVRRSGVSFF